MCGMCVCQGNGSCLNYGAIIPSRGPEDCINHLSLRKLLPHISVTCSLFYESFMGCLGTVCLVKSLTLDISLQFDLSFTWESVLYWSFITCTVLCRELPCASPLGPPVAAGFKPWSYPTPEIRYPMAETPAWGVNSNEKVTQVFKEDTTTSFGGWGSLSAPSLGLCLSGFPGSAYRGKLLLGKRGFISLLLRHRYKHPISPHHLAPSSWHDASEQHRYTCSIWAYLRYLCLLYLFSGIKVVVDSSVKAELSDSLHLNCSSADHLTETGGSFLTSLSSVNQWCGWQGSRCSDEGDYEEW